jgi:hypothetical protein
MGIRCLDFEIFADISNQPIIGVTRSKNDCNMKEIYDNDADEIMNNTVRLEDVLIYLSSTEEGGGYNKETCSNWKDPLILHFRVKSKDSIMYVNMGNLIMKYLGSPLGMSNVNSRLLTPEYGYKYSGNPGSESNNIGTIPLPKLKGKVLIFADLHVCCFPEKTFETDTLRMGERDTDKNQCTARETEDSSCACEEDFFSWTKFPYKDDSNETSQTDENNFHEVINAASHTTMLWAFNKAKYDGFVNTSAGDMKSHNKDFLCIVHPDARTTTEQDVVLPDVRDALEKGVQFIAMSWPVTARSPTSSPNENNISLLETLFNNKIHSKTLTSCEGVGAYYTEDGNIEEDSNNCFLKKLYKCNECTEDDCKVDEAGSKDDADTDVYYDCGNENNKPYFHQESAFMLKPDQLRFDPILLTPPTEPVQVKNSKVGTNIVGQKPEPTYQDNPELIANSLKLVSEPNYKKYSAPQNA